MYKKVITLPEGVCDPFEKNSFSVRSLVLIFFLFLISIVFFRYEYGDSVSESEEDILSELHQKVEGGVILTKKEWAQYCELIEKIWNLHNPKCFCDETKNQTPDIIWSNPPGDPSGLNSDWKDITDPRRKQLSNRVDFINQKTGEKICFDYANRENGSNHWHRYNPDAKGDSDYYLDMCGEPIHKHHKRSHIWIRGLKNAK